MGILLMVFIFLLVVILTVGLLWTAKTQRNPVQKQFLIGNVPNSLNGFYKGNVKGYKGTWQGKKFNASESIGINIFKKEGETSEQFPFKTYVGNGIQDKNIKVLKIDYNIPQNPLWARFILDELVEIEKNQYLGKLHIRFIPFLPFSLGYFKLEKE